MNLPHPRLILAFAFAAMLTPSQAETIMSGGSAQAASPAGAPSGAPGSDDLAKQLANPISSLISVPFQNNFDWGGGPDGDGFQWKLNIQPVIPVSLNQDWNLITRIILPVISQDDIAGIKGFPSGSQEGLGDTTMSMWLSPMDPTKGGWIWGVGVAALIPTGTDPDHFLGNNQWGLGPTAVMLKQEKKWTYGMLVNNLSNVGSRDGRPPTNATFIQPFVAYVPGGGWTYSLNTESTYDWTGEQWTLPINLGVAKLFKIGKQPAQWQLGGRYYADAGPNGPDWGLRAGITLLFPKG